MRECIPTVELARPVSVTLRSGTAGQTAISVIRERILAGELSPGTKLSQHQLATELGMSRIPVRDALRSLAGEGLVTFRANATALVSPLSVEDLQELYELRISLEPRLGRLAIPNLTERHFTEMEAMIERMGSLTDTATWLPLNNRFHETLYTAAGRQRSLDIIAVVRRQTDRYTAVHVELNYDLVDTEHRMILEAARQGQTTRIEALITAHISSSYEQMLRYLAGEARAPGEGTPVDTRGQTRGGI